MPSSNITLLGIKYSVCYALSPVPKFALPTKFSFLVLILCAFSVNFDLFNLNCCALGCILIKSHFRDNLPMFISTKCQRQTIGECWSWFFHIQQFRQDNARLKVRTWARNELDFFLEIFPVNARAGKNPKLLFQSHTCTQKLIFIPTLRHEEWLSRKLLLARLIFQAIEHNGFRLCFRADSRI